jgi:hypothetical protein
MPAKWGNQWCSRPSLTPLATQLMRADLGCCRTECSATAFSPFTDMELGTPQPEKVLD